MSDFNDRVVIVTGAAQGIGRAIALHLAAAGDCVACVDLPSCREEMDKTWALAKERGIPGHRLLGIFCDISKHEECASAMDATLRQFGNVHGLVNNAAIGMQFIGHVLVGQRKRFFEVPTERWREVIDVNVNGSFNMTRAVAPHLVERRFGRIVNITTSYPTMQMAGFSPYGPSKAALEAATVIWAKDLDGTGVTVNALLPGGAADTKQIPATDDVDRAQLLRPEIMGPPCAWLMNSAGDDITGQRFIANAWDESVSPDVAAQKAGAPAGW